MTPGRAGLHAYGGRRRVSGLRREEVALLASISVEYYTQLERGNVRGVSEDVLEAIVRALQLDEVERTHLFDLVRAANRRPARTQRTPERVRPGVQRVLDTIGGSAAFVRKRPPRHPLRQQARLRAVLRGLRQPGEAGEPGSLHLPRPAVPKVL